MKTSSKALITESKQRLLQAKNNIKDTLRTSVATNSMPAKLSKKSVGISLLLYIILTSHLEVFCHNSRIVRLAFPLLAQRADEEFMENLKIVLPASIKGIFAFSYKRAYMELIKPDEDGWRLFNISDEYAVFSHLVVFIHFYSVCVFQMQVGD